MKIIRVENNEKVIMTEKQIENISYKLGYAAFEELIESVSENESNNKSIVSILDDVDIVFEYLYFDNLVSHPFIPEFSVVCEESDRDKFTKGWEDAESEEEEDESWTDFASGLSHSYTDNEDDNFLRKLGYTDSFINSGFKGMYKQDMSPKFIYDRFTELKTSSKSIVFPKEISNLFWNIFQASQSKEIMFFGEIYNTEEKPDEYIVSNINFPPQKNYGGYVETVDGDYEKWIFDNAVLKGKKFPLHVHTHPDFSAFSSSVDEAQIKKFIEENDGNPFIIQLIVSNPLKGVYFIRWFDLENNTYEKPKVFFEFELYDFEKEYPGIFQFNAPRVYDYVIPTNKLNDLYDLDSHKTIKELTIDMDDSMSIDLNDPECMDE